jgi:hypothetical protein
MTINKAFQILVISAGSDNATAYYEAQTSDTTPKRLLLKRTALDNALYFVNHAQMTALGIFSQDVINMYQNEWPTDLTPALDINGTVSASFSGNFAQPDFAYGKVGIVGLNGYDYKTGSFKTVKTSGSISDDSGIEVKWYNKPNIMFGGYVALAAGVITLAIRQLFGKKKRK